MRRPRGNKRAVFLNIPYDKRFTSLYLAYIVGVVELGLEPVATLAIPGGEARLDRIFELVRNSRYSIHDLSRVQIDRVKPQTPRFNMPFELGLSVAWAKMAPESHTFFAFEEVNRRGHKSLSDMAGTDFHIHNGTPKGVMRELCSAFIRQDKRPDVRAMMQSYEVVCAAVPKLLRSCGAQSLFEARAFSDLVTLASESSRDKQS